LTKRGPRIFTFVVLARPSSDVARSSAPRDPKYPREGPVAYYPSKYGAEPVGGWNRCASSLPRRRVSGHHRGENCFPPTPAMFCRRNPLWAPPASYPRRGRRTTCGGHVMGGLNRILARIRRSRRVRRCCTQALATGQSERKKCAKRFGGRVGMLCFRPFPCIKSGFSKVASLPSVDLGWDIPGAGVWYC